jgi:CRISPR-associated protein Cmr2
MGHTASISFGIIIANSNVPLAIALENLWEAEQAAKDYQFSDGATKDAVQVRVLYGNGNIMKTTTKFEQFQEWQQLLNLQQDHPNIFDPALFEQAAMVWEQHPAPSPEAIEPWTNAFCTRRDAFSTKTEGDSSSTPKQDFQTLLVQWLEGMYKSCSEQSRSQEIRSWLKLAAFTLRKRKISCGGED